MNIKTKIGWSCLFALLLFISSAVSFAADNTEIASFSIGYGTGQEMAKTANVVDSKAFIAGLKDSFNNAKPAYSQQELMDASTKLQEIIKTEMEKSGVSSPEEIKGLKLPDKEKSIVSYISGFSFADQLGVMGTLFDNGAILKGLDAAVKGEQNPYSPEEQEKAMVELRKDFEGKMQAELEKAAAPQIEAGKKYIEEFSKKEGVKKTPEGIYYEEIKVGTGESPTPANTVKVDYTGSFVDGTVFDTSIGKQPAIFNAGEVIPGWQMVLPRMKVGDKWKVVIPQEYAYGLNGIQQAGILPGSTLIFEMELLGIEK